MTTTKASTVIAALVTAGYNCSAVQRTPGDWVVISDSNSVNVAVGTVNTFVVNQGIIGQVQHVEYS